MERLIGRKGIYKITGTIGSGGMASVYRAECQGTGGVVAIKMLKEDNPEVAAWQLDNEICVLKQLNEEGIKGNPRLIDEGEGFYVMEYIEGTVLKKGVYSGEESLIIMQKLADILAMMHEGTKPVIYLDLKPSNVMVSENGDLFLIDFGTAMMLDGYKEIGGGRLSNKKSDDFHPQEPNQVVGCNKALSGTRGYAAPEQYGGLGAADIHTDIYAFGNMLDKLVMRSRTDSFLYEEIKGIVKRCTGARKGMRYRDFREVKKALENCSKTACKMRRGFIASIVVLLLLTGLSGILIYKAYTGELSLYNAIISVFFTRLWWNREVFADGRRLICEQLLSGELNSDEDKLIDIVLTCNSIDF